MTIAELFVNLGVKGEGQAVGALKNTEKTLGEVKTQGLAMKAAIIGAIYAMQKFMANSMNAGSNLKTFAIATGMSADMLQKYSYNAEKANVSTGEMEQTFQNIQATMAQGMTSGFSADFAIIAEKVKIDPRRLQDIQYIIDKFNEYAATEKNIPYANERLKSVGYTYNMISAARQKAFSPENLAKAPGYTNKEISNLDDVRKGWFEIGKGIEMAMGHLVARKGKGMVGEIKEAAQSLTAFIGALVKLSEKVKVIEGVGLVFEGWGKIFTKLEEVINKVLGLTGQGGFDWKTSFGDWASELVNGKGRGTPEDEANIKKRFASVGRLKTDSGKELASSLFLPTQKYRQLRNQNFEQDTGGSNVNVTVHNHGVKDTHESVTHAQREYNKAINKNGSRGRAN